MNNYTLYENLNLYFPNEQYENITNSIDEILTLAQLQDYEIRIGKANKYSLCTTLNIDKRKTDEVIILYFDYKIIGEIFQFTSLDTYYIHPHEFNSNNTIPNTNLIETLNETKKLL